MLKCFYIHKDKSRSRRRGELAPELSNESRKNGNSEGNRVTRSTGSVSSPRSIPEMYREREQNLRVFTLSELKEATRNFNRLLKIGEGGFGSVYKGSIQPSNGKGDPIVVAGINFSFDLWCMYRFIFDTSRGEAW